ncbi:hypothetical protein PUR29_35240 [Methylobacterium ajmalii]|uniref:Uncharacterized protein n=1 Tax=Methylobacterium ajmalii TaxID=2738439 RepID=A0ABV0A5Z5_9HYPH
MIRYLKSIAAAAVLMLSAVPAMAWDYSQVGSYPNIDANNLEVRQFVTHGGATLMLPMPAGVQPYFVNAHNLANTPQPDGIFITPYGPFVDYCSIGGCLDGNHLRTTMLINTTTQAGADAQENALAINFTSKTGKVLQYTAGTRYEVGQNVKVFGSRCNFQVGGNTLNDADCIYTPTVAGVAGGNPPNGNPSSYQDGGVTWRYLGAGINDGKTALNIACNAEEGSGQIWCTNFNFSVRYKGAGTAWGEEKDCNNGNEDSNAGSRFFMACTFYGGGGAGTYPFLAHQFVGSGAVNAGGPQPWGAHSFIHIAGEPSDVGSVIKDHVLLDAGNSGSTIRALAGRRHVEGFLWDESNSTRVLRASGSHAVAGIDFQNAQFPSGNAVILPNGSFINWAGGGHIGHNGAIGAFTIGTTNSGETYSVAAHDNGDLSYGNHLGSRGARPTLSACGASTLVDGATDDHGIISVEAGTTACALNFAQARQKKAACTFWMSSGQGVAGGTSGSGAQLLYPSAPLYTEIHYHCLGR